MIDIAKTCAPKSDQLNADDLIGGPRTIIVTGIKLVAEDQPVAIYFQGDDGKPWKPCKSMRRVLVKAWGSDGASYSGRSITLYVDEKVRFGGTEVGGIRISHLSHISAPVTMALTATRGSKKAFTVRALEPIAKAPDIDQPQPDEEAKQLIAAGEIAAGDGVEMYSAFLANLTPEQKSKVKPHHSRLSKMAKVSDAENPQ